MATDELIVLVNELGEPVGSAPKLASHHKNTPLHLAFSVYIFDQSGRVLVTQRAHSKKVWPDVWTNSCCGHPLPGEIMKQAINRRARFELGIAVENIKVALPDYRYVTPPYNGIIENEICPVFFAESNETPEPNGDEVDAYKWVTWSELRSEISQDKGNQWSWWCKDQMKQLHRPHRLSEGNS